MVNQDTVDDFLEKAYQQGFIVSMSLRRNDRFIDLLTSSHYVPMTFHDNDEYVHINTNYEKQTMEEVLELIKEAKDTSHDIYRFNAGKEIVIYQSKKVLI